MLVTESVLLKDFREEMLADDVGKTRAHVRAYNKILMRVPSEYPGLALRVSQAILKQRCKMNLINGTKISFVRGMYLLESVFKWVLGLKEVSASCQNLPSFVARGGKHFMFSFCLEESALQMII